jgi:hypothetical protein
MALETWAPGQCMAIMLVSRVLASVLPVLAGIGTSQQGPQ